MKTEPLPPAESTAEGRLVKKERLEKVLEYFSARQENSIHIQNSRSLIVDPSR